MNNLYFVVVIVAFIGLTAYLVQQIVNLKAIRLDAPWPPESVAKRAS